MYTQQAQRLLATLGAVANNPTAMSLVSTLANCAQPLTTRAGMVINAAGSQYPPGSGGTISGFPGSGAGDWSTVGGGDTWSPSAYTNLFLGGGDGGGIGGYDSGNGDIYFPAFNPSRNDYISEGYPYNPPGGAGGDYYNTNVYNAAFRNGDLINNFATNDGTYWGGDTLYGDTNISNQFTQNLNEWYTNQYTDQSYNDFSTHLNVTSNAYNQSVNNISGDTYFDNTVTNNLSTVNNVTHQGPVTNNNTVTNNNNVFHGGNVFHAGDVFIRQGDTTQQFFPTTFVTLKQFLKEVVREEARKYTLEGKVRVPKYAFDDETCSLYQDGYTDADTSDLKLVAEPPAPQ